MNRAGIVFWWFSLLAGLAVGDVLDENRVTYGIDNAGYRRLHLGYKGVGETRVDKAGYEKMRATYLTELSTRVAARPTDAALALEYGEALMFKGDFAAAESVLTRALEQPSAKGETRAKLFYRAAECRLKANDRDGCRRLLTEALDVKAVSGQRKNLVKDALTVLTGVDATLDLVRLPQTRHARAYPEPHKVTYGETLFPLGDVRLVCRGVAAGDARIRLLKGRLARLGLKVEEGAGKYPLTIELTPTAPVDRLEGYALSVTEKGATIRARERQGVLWGVISFLQLIDYTERAIRPAEIEDWADTAARGYLGEYWPGCAEYTLFQKMNSVVLRFIPTRQENWSPLNTLMLETVCRQFRELGLTLYCGMNDLTKYPPHLPLCWPETLDYMTEICRRYAALGAGAYFAHDDERYPLAPPDLEAGGSGTTLDAEFVTKLYRAVKRDYPDFKMVYCPPYYYGPYSGPTYPDDRDAYLKSLGEKLDREIGVYWTGPQVKGRDKTPEQLAWYEGLIGRKPCIFQNATGPHNLLSFLVDETDWNGWHYPGFFEKDITAFHKNAHTPRECPQTATLADCLWNVKGYDKARSVRRGVAQLLGDEVFDILSPALADLAYFDKYYRGAITAEIFHEKPDDLDAKVKTAETAWQRAKAANPQVADYGFWEYGVSLAKGIAKAARNPPDVLARYRTQAEGCRKLAEAEVGVDPTRGDLFFSPVDIGGADVAEIVQGGPEHCTETRFTKCLRAAQTIKSTSIIAFECDPFPPSGPYDLYLCGLDDELPAKVTVRLSVNGTTFFEGDPGFVNSTKFTVRKFTVPFAALKRYNTIKIEVLSKGFNQFGPPWLMLNYAVLKKTR